MNLFCNFKHDSEKIKAQLTEKLLLKINTEIAAYKEKIELMSTRIESLDNRLSRNALAYEVEGVIRNQWEREIPAWVIRSLVSEINRLQLEKNK